MNEHGFTRAVLAKVPSEVHRQSMTSASLSNNGTPDRYLDFNRDLWVEFKYHPAFPRLLKPYDMLTALQLRWLERRWDAGQNAIVVIGMPYEKRTMGVVFDKKHEWRQDHTRDSLRERLLSVHQIADYIYGRVK